MINSFNGVGGIAIGRHFLHADIILSMVTQTPNGLVRSKATMNGKPIDSTTLRQQDIYEMLSFASPYGEGQYLYTRDRLLRLINEWAFPNDTVLECYKSPGLSNIGFYVIKEIKYNKDYLNYITRLAESILSATTVINTLSDRLKILAYIDTIIEIDSTVINVSEILTAL